MEFRKFLQGWRKEYADAEIREDDPHKSARLKGTIRTIDRILGLHEEIAEYIRGVSNGKFKKIVTERGVVNV